MQNRGRPVWEAEKDILVAKKKIGYKSVCGDEKIALDGSHILMLMQKGHCELIFVDCMTIMVSFERTVAYDAD